MSLDAEARQAIAAVHALSLEGLSLMWSRVVADVDARVQVQDLMQRHRVLLQNLGVDEAATKSSIVELVERDRAERAAQREADRRALDEASAAARQAREVEDAERAMADAQATVQAAQATLQDARARAKAALAAPGGQGT